MRIGLVIAGILLIICPIIFKYVPALAAIGIGLLGPIFFVVVLVLIIIGFILLIVGINVKSSFENIKTIETTSEQQQEIEKIE